MIFISNKLLFCISGALTNQSCVFPFQFGQKKYYILRPDTRGDHDLEKRRDSQGDSSVQQSSISGRAGVVWHHPTLDCFPWADLDSNPPNDRQSTCPVRIFHDFSYFSIPVLMISKLEKSELSIRLADKMDKMDRTWKQFISPFFRMCNRKVLDLFGFRNDVNETYPDIMEEYQLAAEIRGYNWYQQRNRQDEFLMYVNGKVRIVMRISGNCNGSLHHHSRSG